MRSLLNNLFEQWNVRIIFRTKCISNFSSRFLDPNSRQNWSDLKNLKVKPTFCQNSDQYWNQYKSRELQEMVFSNLIQWNKKISNGTNNCDVETYRNKLGNIRKLLQIWFQPIVLKFSHWCKSAVVKLAEKKLKKIGRYLGSKTLLTKLNSTCISLLLIAMYYF